MTAPSRAAVKCKVCNKQFCNKAYFLKNHFGKEHKQSQLDAETQWRFVLKREGISKWEEKANPKCYSKKKSNPFIMALGAKNQVKSPTKLNLNPIQSLVQEPNIKVEEKENIKPNSPLLKRKRVDKDQEDKRKIKRSRIVELEVEIEKLKIENEFLKRERAENAEKEWMRLKSLQQLQEKSSTFVMEFKATVDDIKTHHKSQKEEVTEMHNTTKRDWILRKIEGIDERRFCLPCLK